MPLERQNWELGRMNPIPRRRLPNFFIKLEVIKLDNPISIFRANGLDEVLMVTNLFEEK